MDDSTLHSVFWNHLVYPELASGEVADATVSEEWIRERLPDGRWPEFVVCLAVDGLDTAEPEVRIHSVEGVRALVEDRLGPTQRALFGFAHTNAVYFCGCFDTGRTEFIKSLESLQQVMKTGLAISSSIGVAFLPEATLEGLRFAAQYAIVAQRRKVRYGLNRVFVWDASTSPAPIDLGEYWTLARRIQSVIRTGDLLETELALMEITKALFEDRYLNLIHLRNLTTLASAGATILPAMPAFYQLPKTMDDLVDSVVYRVVAQLGIPIPDSARWSGEIRVRDERADSV